MDAVSQQRLLEVNPELRLKATDLMAQFWDEFHYSLRVTQGLRSWLQQEVLYAQGRTAPGNIVTYAKPGYSYHNYGLAIDVVPMVPLGNGSLVSAPDWNIQHPVWKNIVSIGEELGLDSGMHFSHPDGPHFQLTGRFPEVPDDEIRALYTKGYLPAVWSELNPNTEIAA